MAKKARDKINNCFIVVVFKKIYVCFIIMSS